MNSKTLIASAVTAALLGTAGVSIAGATTRGSATTQSPAPAASTTTATQAANNSSARGMRVLRLLRRGVKIAAQTIGITPKQLRAELHAGESIADVATEHGKSPQDVITALVTAATNRIKAAETAGKISAERAAKLEANLPTRVTKLVNRHFAH
jgi:hypothetical protein